MCGMCNLGNMLSKILASCYVTLLLAPQDESGLGTQSRPRRAAAERAVKRLGGADGSGSGEGTEDLHDAGLPSSEQGTDEEGGGGGGRARAGRAKRGSSMMRCAVLGCGLQCLLQCYQILLAMLHLAVRSLLTVRSSALYDIDEGEEATEEDGMEEEARVAAPTSRRPTTKPRAAAAAASGRKRE